jgi:hypothetical protein
MARVTWRMRFAPLIHAALAANEEEKARRRALREGWRSLRFSTTRCWPYKVWRSEARIQMGLIPRSRKRPAHRSALQLVLPGVTGDD